MLVLKLHRLPFERAKLMERLYLDPLDILHRGNEPSDLIDVGGIIGESRHQCEAHPYRLADCGQPLGEAQRWRQIPGGRGAIGFRIPAFDVQQHEIEAREIAVVGAVTEKARCLDRRMKAHLSGRSQYSPGEAELHHRLSALDGEAAVERPQGWRKRAEAV